MPPDLEDLKSVNTWSRREWYTSRPSALSSLPQSVPAAMNSISDTPPSASANPLTRSTCNMSVSLISEKIGKLLVLKSCFSCPRLNPLHTSQRQQDAHKPAAPSSIEVTSEYTSHIKRADVHKMMFCNMKHYWAHKVKNRSPDHHM